MKKEYRVDSLVNEYAQKYPDLLSESLATNEGLERALASVSKLREAHQAAFKHFDSEVLERTFESVSRMRATHQAMFGGSALQRVIDNFTKLREMQQAAVGAFPKSDTLLQAMENMFDGGVSSQFRALEKISEGWMSRAQASGMQALILDIERRLGEINLPAIDESEVGLVAEELEIADVQIVSRNDLPHQKQASSSLKCKEDFLTPNQKNWISLIGFMMSAVGLFCAFYDCHATRREKSLLNDNQSVVIQINGVNQLFEYLFYEGIEGLNTYFDVRERVASVRSKPKHGSMIKNVLMPNDRVKLLRTKGKWVEVRYYDKTTQEAHSGWVLKKYLERVST